MNNYYDSVIIKHHGRMYVWCKYSWDEDPTGHIRCGRELIAQGDFFVLRNIADLYNQSIQENQDANN